MAELVELGAARLHPTSNVVEAQCQGSPAGEGQAPDYGNVPLLMALGVAAMPAPASDAGSAQAVVIPVEGTDGVVVGAYDPRSAATYFNLAPGETCVHASGEKFDSRALFKKQRLALIVGDDMVFSMDHVDDQIVFSYDGNAIKVSKSDGIVLSTGGASIQLKGDTMILNYKSLILGGRTPNPVQKIMLGPPTGSPGAAASAPMTAMPGVFVGM